MSTRYHNAYHEFETEGEGGLVDLKETYREKKENPVRSFRLTEAERSRYGLA